MLPAMLWTVQRIFVPWWEPPEIKTLWSIKWAIKCRGIIFDVGLVPLFIDY